MVPNFGCACLVSWMETQTVECATYPCDTPYRAIVSVAIGLVRAGGRSRANSPSQRFRQPVVLAFNIKYLDGLV